MNRRESWSDEHNNYNLNSNTQQMSGMSSNSFFGLIFELFIVGLVLGSVGFLGFEYYKKEMRLSSGTGFSVRFIRQDGDKASVN